MEVTIHIPVKHHLSDAEVDQMVDSYFNRLKKERWVRDGKLWEEAYTSHRFDWELGGPDHPDYQLVEAIQNLQNILKERKNARHHRP